MLTSLGDRCFVLGLGEGIGALPANVSSLTLGERLSSSSARTWKFAGYSLMQPILGPTPVLHMLDIGLFSSTLVPNWHTFSLPQLLAVALAPTLPSMCSNGSSSFTGLEGGTSSSIGSLCSRQHPWNYLKVKDMFSKLILNWRPIWQIYRGKIAFKVIYLYICHIHFVFLQEASEFHKILLCWTVVATVGPYSLHKM